MYQKRLLIFVFWIIVWLSAIYLRTAIFPNNGLLITVATIDVFLLYVISLLTFYILKNVPDTEFTKKVSLLFIMVLSFSTIRYWIDAYQMGYWKSVQIEIAPRMVVAKILSSVVILGISLAYYLGERFVEAEEQKMNFKMEKKQLELDFLKSRVNPHFLFNTLSNIHGLAQFKSDKTAPMIEELSDLMRYMFYDCQEDQIAIEKEIEFIKNYIKLNQLKSSKDLNIKFEYKIETRNFRIEPLMFVSFIENAFKHGDIFQNGFITISLKQKKSRIEFCCKNSYIEPSKQLSKPDQSGFGLSNIIKRLESLYPNAHTLDIHDNGRFEIKLSLTTK
jgi:sensor histidine kinase YesM